MLRLRTCLFVPFVVVALLGPSGVADQPATPQQFDQVRALIRERLAQSQIPSISVAVARDGKIIWEEGFGWADREKKIPANEHTMYSLASISKPITMTGLMALVQQGKVDLDRPINDYLRDAKVTARVGHAADATVRRVANHTAGLPVHLQCFYENEPFRPPKMSETISRYGNLITPPGEQFNYSNLGYGILSHLIEQVSGQDFGDFMRKEIFQPLNLPHMSVVSLNVRPENIGQAALRYGDDGQPLPFFTSDHPGASDIYSCVHDLVRFGMVHLKEHLADQKV
ncbi:MAG TPA: serine hydrolase domain-containing protein, partial [Blastocatellia bacterium]|nr:serine hydrolase domain-containing protein [Blastocatellia bacterium]